MKEKLIKLISMIPDDFRCPQQYIDKYNTISSRKNPSGRAWVMWFIDKAEKEGILK